jgi:tetratricopeptide (TPR) repeat protein
LVSAKRSDWPFSGSVGRFAAPADLAWPDEKPQSGSRHDDVSEARAAYEAGLRAAKAGDDKAAVESYSRAIELYGSEHTEAYAAFGQRATALRRLGLLKEALNDNNRAIELNPQEALEYYDRGVTYLKLRRYQDALSDFDNFLRTRPDSSDGYMGRGNALYDLGRLAEALDALGHRWLPRPRMAL